MTLYHAIFWGLLQGLTEFLPVSSSGHLALIPWLVQWPVPDLLFDLVVHLGTLAAILVYMRRDVAFLFVAAWRVIRTRKISDEGERLVVLIVLSAIPASILGALINTLVDEALQVPWVVSLLLAGTGTVLYVAERLGRRERTMDSLRPRDAWLIGVAQALALLPGLSRSGTTIATGLMRGLRRHDAARFSFLMALPVIAGAAGVQLVRGLSGGMNAEAAANLTMGFVMAGLGGYAALHFLFRYLQGRNLRPFAYYCWAIALLGLTISLVR